MSRVFMRCVLSLLHLATAYAALSFGHSIKGQAFTCKKETTVFSYSCPIAPCAMQHWWSGGNFDGYTKTIIRYYVDDEYSEPLNIPIGAAHGGGGIEVVDEDNGPWSAGALFGKSGGKIAGGALVEGSGFFNTFPIPFARTINITVALGCPGGSQRFWLIVRGRTEAKIVLPGGLALPPSARLRSFENTTANLPPHASLSLVNVSRGIQGGAVLLTTLSVSSPHKSFSFLEGEVRASTSPATAEEEEDASYLISSGTEDYFLGTFYFDRGQYMNPLAGVTALCPQPNKPMQSYGCTPAKDGSVAFAAYRVHAGHEPLLFESDGFVLTWRNGEPGHGTAVAVNASAFGLAYVW